MVMKDVFDRSRYGSSYEISELVQKILGERLRHHDPSPPHTEDRVIYANPDRHSILDNVTLQLRPRLPEIPEGGDEKDFAEKTLAPSGRRWTSSPSPDSQRIVVVRNLFDDDNFGGGLRYEDIGVGARECGTSLENLRDSSCHSPSNVPDTPNGERVEAEELEGRWTGALPAAGRTVVSSERTRHHEIQTVREAPAPTSTTRSRMDTSGCRIPADAIEIKVQMQRGESANDKEHLSFSKSRFRDESSSAAVENWLNGSSEKSSPASCQRGFVGGGGVETDEKLEAKYGSAQRHENYSNQVEDVGITPRTSSDGGWTKVAGTKSTGKTSSDDGRVWIPVIHVSGASASKNETTKSDTNRSLQLLETDNQRDEAVSSTIDNRGQVSISSRAFVDVTDPRRQVRSGAAEFTESAKDTEQVAEVAGSAHQSAVSSSLRTGSGVGSYGFRSSIVVDRGSRPVVSPTSSSRSTHVMQQSASDGDWIVDKALQ